MTPERPETSDEPQEVPLGQRLLDRPFLLLIVCTAIMLVFYTGWGVIEMFSLPEAPLP